jgi:HTH-type transcriptional regulator/antitoxin HipB
LHLTPVRVNLILSPIGGFIKITAKEGKMRVTSPSALANAVRDQRKVNKLTQVETAERVGIKQTTVSDFENRPGATKLETLFKILSSLDLELQVVKRGATLNENNAWKKEW